MRQSLIEPIQNYNQAATAEDRRLAAALSRKEDWQRWGPYLSER